MTMHRGVIITLLLTLLTIILAGTISVHSAPSVAVIGGSDGPTAIYVTQSTAEPALPEGAPAQQAAPAPAAQP